MSPSVEAFKVFFSGTATIHGFVRIKAENAEEAAKIASEKVKGDNDFNLDDYDIIECAVTEVIPS